MGDLKEVPRKDPAPGMAGWLLNCVVVEPNGGKIKPDTSDNKAADLIVPGVIWEQIAKEVQPKVKKPGNDAAEDKERENKYFKEFDKWLKDKQVLEKWTTEWLKERGRLPTGKEEATFIKDKRITNYPYNETLVNHSVDDIVNHKNVIATYEAAKTLQEITDKLVDMGDDRAKKMVEPLKKCLLAEGMNPDSRARLLDGFERLLWGGYISKDDFAETVGKALQQDLKDAPKIEPDDNLFKATFHYEKAEAALLRMVKTLGFYNTPKGKEVLKAIADDENCPVPKVRECAKALLREEK